MLKCSQILAFLPPFIDTLASKLFNFEMPK